MSNDWQAGEKVGEVVGAQDDVELELDIVEVTLEIFEVELDLVEVALV